MKTKCLLTAVLAAVLLAGCVSSVFPLLTEDDLVFDPALIGIWGDSDPKNEDPEKETWMFNKRDGDAASKVYTLIIQANGRPAKFDARLGRIGGKLFLELELADLGEAEDKLNGWAKAALGRNHIIMRVQELGPNLKLCLPDLDRFLQENPKALAHREQAKDPLILTAPTAELQAFFIQHADNPKIFSCKDSSGLKRVAIPLAAKK
ncbi:hypothetical protein LBMAG56_32030 [Verrucomicrobiota bacterium]|nr:hypothetical protein LBMAG56_32030 [Verrucomicrobiota bacterium]